MNKTNIFILSFILTNSFIYNPMQANKTTPSENESLSLLPRVVPSHVLINRLINNLRSHKNLIHNFLNEFKKHETFLRKFNEKVNWLKSNDEYYSSNPKNHNEDFYGPLQNCISLIQSNPFIRKANGWKQWARQVEFLLQQILTINTNTQQHTNPQYPNELVEYAQELISPTRIQNFIRNSSEIENNIKKFINTTITPFYNKMEDRAEGIKNKQRIIYSVFNYDSDF